MRRVGEHILASDVVAGLLFTDQDLETFYSRLGWRSVNVGRILVQSREPEDLVMWFGDGPGYPTSFNSTGSGERLSSLGRARVPRSGDMLQR